MKTITTVDMTDGHMVFDAARLRPEVRRALKAHAMELLATGHHINSVVEQSPMGSEQQEALIAIGNRIWSAYRVFLADFNIDVTTLEEMAPRDRRQLCIAGRSLVSNNKTADTADA